MEVDAMTEQPLTIEEVAALLRMQPQGVRRLIRRGQLQAVKIGKRYLIQRAEVQRLLEVGTEPIVLAGGRTFPKDA
jgi:excisionase family DNA binding protein